LSLFSVVVVVAVTEPAFVLGLYDKPECPYFMKKNSVMVLYDLDLLAHAVRSDSFCAENLVFLSLSTVLSVQFPGTKYVQTFANVTKTSEKQFLIDAYSLICTN